MLAASLGLAGCRSNFWDMTPIPADSNAATAAELAAILRRPDRELASLATIVLRNGEIVFEGYYGQRWIDATGVAHRPATVDTLYRVASISKWVTALGVLTLLAQARLDLDRDISSYLGVAVRNPNFPSQAITLRMLLCHTSSLRDDAGYSFPEADDIRDVLLARGAFAGKRSVWSRDAAPGQAFAYCNLASGVIATLIETVTGQRFDRFMQDAVFSPLGVQATFDPAHLPTSALQHVATLYRKRVERQGREQWEPRGPWRPQVDDYEASPPVPRTSAAYVPGRNGSLLSPQGGLRIGARGLATLVQVVLNHGRHRGRLVFNGNWIDEMFRPQWQRGESATAKGTETVSRSQAWGLGAQIFTDTFAHGRGDWLRAGGGLTAVGHLGDAYGLTSAVLMNRHERCGVVFLSGGVGFDPATDTGRYSGFYRYEELILDALWRVARSETDAR
ncbi:MAG: beta-lactamase family protein [Burkholderiales bacterium]|nr:beta-lactamase family protein [Burkholderiales bacterium]